MALLKNLYLALCSRARHSGSTPVSTSANEDKIPLGREGGSSGSCKKSAEATPDGITPSSHLSEHAKRRIGELGRITLCEHRTLSFQEVSNLSTKLYCMHTDHVEPRPVRSFSQALYVPSIDPHASLYPNDGRPIKVESIKCVLRVPRDMRLPPVEAFKEALATEVPLCPHLALSNDRVTRALGSLDDFGLDDCYSSYMTCTRSYDRKIHLSCQVKGCHASAMLHRFRQSDANLEDEIVLRKTRYLRSLRSPTDQSWLEAIDHNPGAATTAVQSKCSDAQLDLGNASDIRRRGQLAFEQQLLQGRGRLSVATGSASGEVTRQRDRDMDHPPPAYTEADTLPAKHRSL